MNKDKITVISEKFDISYDLSGEAEEVVGITVLINDEFKEVMETLMKINNIDNYTEMLKDVIFEGVSNMLNNNK